MIDSGESEDYPHLFLLLNEFDDKIQAAHTEKEKALYKVFMYVLENELTTARVFLTGKKN